MARRKAQQRFQKLQPLQAELLEQYVVDNQTIFAVNADGYADGIAGVSVHAVGFYSLFNQAFGK